MTSNPVRKEPILDSSFMEQEQPRPAKQESAPAPEAKPAAKKSQKSPSAFRTISEVANELKVQQHVLRFWETKFSQVRPLKRGGGRRYYRPEDVALLKRIHHLLYTEGYTIKGVQKLLKGQGKSQIAAQGASEAPRNENKPAPLTATPTGSVTATPAKPLSPRQKAVLENMLGELKELRSLVKAG